MLLAATRVRGANGSPPGTLTLRLPGVGKSFPPGVRDGQQGREFGEPLTGAHEGRVAPRGPTRRDGGNVGGTPTASRRRGRRNAKETG